ncbi:MAG: hypothetical protein WC496_01070 [Phycisphaerae bacterium]|jgi:hypothetical protein
MSKLVGKLRRPELNKKKIAIIIAIVAFVCLSASGGLYYMLKDKAPADDGFGPPRMREWHDANMPNPQKQTVKEIMDYRSSDRYKQLSQREQMMYSMMSGRQVMEYQMETYFTLPKEEKTAYLDKMIDDMQDMRKNFEQMRSQMPRRPRDANDPNVQRRRDRAQQAGQTGGRRAPDPSRMRARSERGTALQRAQRQQFMADMQARMQQRGISMPGPGGRGGPGGR